MTILLCYNYRLTAALKLGSKRRLFSCLRSKSDKLLLDNVVTRRSFLIPSFELHGGVSGLFDFGPPGFALKENILSLWKSHFVVEDGLLQIESAALTPHVVLKASGHVDKFEDIMVKDVKTGECYRADKLLEEHLQTRMLSSPTSKESEGRKGRADGAGEGENKNKQKEGDNISRAELASLSAKVSSLSLVEIAHVISRLQIKSPNNNDLSPPFPFNLMFATSIGPTGTQRAFLRPETAQGMFVNFKRLYEFNGGRLPMGVAQIGLAFRNEIAPRGGLLRVREFTLAEIEYFVHPEKKKHHNKFDTIKNVSLPLLTARTQQQQVTDDSITPLSSSSSLLPSQTIPVQTPLHVAVHKNEIGNETLAYFMARTYMFLLAVGISPECIRFREHMPNEMAHYAASCWDAEILTSQGWVECVGLADRSAFDLESHSSATGVDLVAREKLAEPIEEPFIAVKANRREIGRTHRGDQALVVSALEAIAENKPLVEDLERKLVEKGSADVALSDGRTVSVTRAMVSFEKGLRKISEKKFAPHVIEPSFGIGRIMAALLEHSFYVRREELSEVKGKDAGLINSLSSTSLSTEASASTTQDLSRCVLRFSPRIAPYKAVLLPLDGRVDSVMVRSLSRSLASAGLSAYVDDSSNSIGKRYARADELGVPFAITVDFESAKDAHVTIRERDSTLQTRMQVESVVEYIRKRVEEV